MDSKAQANRSQQAFVEAVMATLPERLPWTIELDWTYPDVCAAFWRFFVMAEESSHVRPGMLRVMRGQQPHLLQMRQLTTGSVQFSLVDEVTALCLVRWQFDSVRRSTRTRIRVELGNTHLFPDSLEFMTVFQYDPSDSPQIVRAASFAEQQRVVVVVTMYNFLAWFYHDQGMDEYSPTDSAMHALTVIPDPPNPREHGWDATFDWYYQYGKPRRMTMPELAILVGYAPQTVRNRKSEYDAEHGLCIRKKRDKESTNTGR